MECGLSAGSGHFCPRSVCSAELAVVCFAGLRFGLAVGWRAGLVAWVGCGRVGGMALERARILFSTSCGLWANVAGVAARAGVQIWSANAARRDTDL